MPKLSEERGNSSPVIMYRSALKTSLLLTTLHQDTNDIHTLKFHLKRYEYLYQNLSESLTADAGYGSQENFELLPNKGIQAYVKFNTFDKSRMLRGRKQMPLPSTGTAFITMRKKIIMYARWDSGWIKYLRIPKQQNLVTSKPIVNIELKTAKAVQ